MTISLPPKGSSAKKLESYFSPLRVQAQAVPTSTCRVAEGTFWTAANTHQEYLGGTTPTIFGVIDVPNTSKWVMVTLTKDGVLNTIDGDAAASPVLPLPETYVDELPLAAIFVTNASPLVITNEMIFDIRPLWSVPVETVTPADFTNYYTRIQVDNKLDTKAGILGTTSYEFTLGDGITSHNNAALKINRISPLDDVEIRFNEFAVTDGSPAVLDPRWEFTNDGINYETLGVASGNYYTKVASDARFTPISHLIDDVLHITPTQDAFLDGLTLGSPDLSADDVNQLIGITGNVQTQINADALNLTNHMADADVHMTVSQNTFLDGLTLGSPDLSADDVNQLIGITGNVQTLLDAKLGDVTGVAGNIATLAGSPTNELVDSGWTINNVGTTANDLWSGDKLSTLLPASAVFNDLTDVTISGGVTINDLVHYDGGDWVNVTVLTAIGDAYVRRSGSVVEAITGVKTFNDDAAFLANVDVTGDLTVSGATATFQTANLNVDDTNITLNFSYAAASTAPSHGGGLTVNRGTVDPAASLIWDDGNGYWTAGLAGSEAEIVTKGEARTQPFYELTTGIGGSPGAAYELGFDVPMPIGATAAVQVFVNGIKQIEGAGKAYTVTYGGSPVAVIVAFNAGSEPTVGADVEFYGFGYLA